MNRLPCVKKVDMRVYGNSLKYLLVDGVLKSSKYNRQREIIG